MMMPLIYSIPQSHDTDLVAIMIPLKVCGWLFVCVCVCVRVGVWVVEGFHTMCNAKHNIQSDHPSTGPCFLVAICL